MNNKVYIIVVFTLRFLRDVSETARGKLNFVSVTHWDPTQYVMKKQVRGDLSDSPKTISSKFITWVKKTQPASIYLQTDCHPSILIYRHS